MEWVERPALEITNPVLGVAVAAAALMLIAAGLFTIWAERGRVKRRRLSMAEVRDRATMPVPPVAKTQMDVLHIEMDRHARTPLGNHLRAPLYGNHAAELPPLSCAICGVPLYRPDELTHVQWHRRWDGDGK